MPDTRVFTNPMFECAENYDELNPYGPGGFQFEGDDVYVNVDDDDEVVETIPRNNKGISINEGAGSGNKSRAPMTQKGKGKRHESTKIGDYFAPRTTLGSQPTIKSALQTKEAIHRAHMIVGKFFYDTCIPINAVNSIYFQPMFDAAIAIGPGYKSSWAACGCTIMGDCWTDARQRNLINFLVYSPMGIAFVKSIDASDAVKDATLLSKLFLEVIEWVRVSNVVHMVTDNGANYKAAGGLVNATYKSMNWSPCAAYCLNLILSEISKMNHVHELAIKASTVTRYIYNRSWLLARLRKKKSWAEIVRPEATRFATTFLALRSIHEHMHDLQALVTSKEFASSRFAKEKKGKDAIDIILDKQFWKDCFIIVKIVEPLMRLLCIVDGDEKPSMGYVYEGMYRAIKGVKDIFKRNKKLYRPYTTIIKTRWDNQLRKNIYAAAYWLNPTFQYDQASFCKKPEVMNSVLDVIETKATSSKTKLMNELRLFRDRQDSFGRELAIITSKKTQPDEWWKMFGHSAPNLKKLAIQILSQTSSSSGCERNWSAFERIHTKKRNRLEHHRLNDLVKYYKTRNYDPIDIESIDKTEFWIIEEEILEQEPPLLDYDEFEKMLYEEDELPRYKKQCHGLRDDDVEDDMVVELLRDDIDLGSFGDVNIDNRSNNLSSSANANENDDDDWLNYRP
ncbi:uncharacterized protein LOC114312528 [Camellia sinensis]|uniref:uncharacterized protein LOC114312528 n=1 Tax=Camellia sinensis TaxID=4442 RepID=UPI0010358E04|nr:uncharacterized protein LOC114312528 [Camellia sinensis]